MQMYEGAEHALAQLSAFEQIALLKNKEKTKKKKKTGVQFTECNSYYREWWTRNGRNKYSFRNLFMKFFVHLVQLTQFAQCDESNVPTQPTQSHWLLNSVAFPLGLTSPFAQLAHSARPAKLIDLIGPAEACQDHLNYSIRQVCLDN